MNLSLKTNFLNFIIFACTIGVSCTDDYEKHIINVPACKTSSCIKASVPGIFFTRKQPSKNSCWATAVAMLYSWKQQRSVSETAVLKAYPEYLQLFKEGNKSGITIAQELYLYKNLGVAIEKQLNPTIEGWAEYINTNGPLSITIDAKPPYGGTIHAIILTAIYGESTGLRTRIIYADPADGKLHDQDFLDFMKMYEAKSSVDWPIQIIQF
jgi:hypothetical protein